MRVKDHNGDSVTHGPAVANGVWLRHTTAGSGDPVFLLNGVPKTSYHRRHAIPLPTPHYTAIAPDVRDRGDSQYPTSGYDARNVAACLEEPTRVDLGFFREGVGA
ncbi:MAG: hypothetical protein IN808_04650 [Rubrobacter sp.]|jgi:hypothetical protein|nr:hypothetical protein [Rubrobacter sp.]